MNNQSLYAPIIDSIIQFVEVVFAENNGEYGTKRYKYKTDLILSVDDVVVVEARNHYQVVKVVAVDVGIPMDDCKYRWVVSRVHVDAHENRLKNEQELIKRVSSLRAKRMRTAILGEMGLTEEDKIALINYRNNTVTE